MLPAAAETAFPGLLKKYAGIKDSGIDIRKISFTKMDAAELTLGSAGNPFLSVESIRADYSPLSLLHGKFKKLSIGGGYLRCNELKSWTSGGKAPEKKSGEQSAAAAPETEPVKLPGCPGEIELRNFIIEAETNGRTIRVPVNISVKPQGKNWFFSFNIMPFDKGKGLRGKGSFDPDNMSLGLDSLDLDFTGAENSPLLSQLNGIRMGGELRASGKISFPDNVLSCEMKAIWQDASITRPGLEIKPAPGKKGISIAVSGSGKSFNIEMGNASVQAGETTINADSLKLRTEEKNGILNITINETPIMTQSADFKIPGGLKLSANIAYDQNKKTHNLSATLKADELLAGSGKISAAAPQIKIVSENNKSAASLSTGQVKLPGELSIESLEAEYPLSGKASIKTGFIMHSAKKLGKIDISIETRSNALRYIGEATELAFPGMKFSFKGKAFFTGETVADYKLSIKDLSVLKPEEFSKQCQGFELAGSLESKGTAAFKPGEGLVVPLGVNLDGLCIKNKEKNISAEGLTLVFFVPDALDPSGAGRQRLTFQKITAGNLKIGPGIVLFRMEPQNACFIEKFESECTEGNIAFHALKIIPGRPDYRTVLFCNKLNFADVLTQLGIVNGAEGKGTVSGRIPLVYYNGELSVEKGFLYSSPGDGGRIRLSSPDVLSPELLGADLADSVQAGNIELTRQALTAFDYKWTKLDMNSENDILIVKLSMYGKPAAPLLFRYDEDLGGYLKVKSEEEGSIFTDMMLEFNFRLPVNKMIGYGNGVWKIFDEFKK